MKINTKSTITKLLLITVAGLGLFIGFLALRRNMVLSTKALMPEITGQIYSEVMDPLNGLSEAKINFKTDEGVSREAVSTVKLKILISSFNGKDLKLADSSGVEVREVKVGGDFTAEKGWLIAVNKVTKTENGLLVEFLAVNTSKDGYSSDLSKTLLDFHVSGAIDKNDININIDKTNSELLSKRRPVTNIWKK